MKIGLDARALGGRLTGDRTYWRGLVEGLADVDSGNKYVLLLRSPLTESDRMVLPDNFQVKVVPAPTERVWSLFTFGRALRAEHVDLAHVQYTLPPGIGCPAVTTVHDISFRLYPELFSLKDRCLLNLSIPSSMRRAQAVITVSQSSRKDILAAYPFLSPDKVTAAELAVGPEFHPLNATEQIAGRAYLKEKYDLSGNFVLSVGVLQPRKNLPMLIDAFSRARRRAGFSQTLAIAGKVGWLSSSTQTAIIKACEDVQLLGYVADEDLPILYGCADITVYPSLYEGFGLPVLEAMACGCPVVASNNSSLPEVAGEAGILLSADDATGWEEALIRVIEDAALRSKMRLSGIAQASKFSWKKTAGKTIEVYKRAAAGRRSQYTNDNQ